PPADGKDDTAEFTAFPEWKPAPDATRVRTGLANEAFAYLARMRQIREANMGSIELGLPEFTDVVAVAMRARVELEGERAGRGAGRAACVVEAKEAERFVAERVRVGGDAPRALDLARFYRLGIELEALDLGSTPPRPARP